MMVGPMSPKPRALAVGGAWTRDISSQKIACCMSVALRPPYSLGQETAAQRPPSRFRCHALKYGNVSSSGFSLHWAQSLGMFASSHVRSSSRNWRSSAVRLRSIQDSIVLGPHPHAHSHPPVFLLRRRSTSLRFSELRPDRVLSLPIFLTEL